jgi:hypothetical protein
VSPTSACPGCGVELPASDWPLDRPVNASPACWHLCTEVTAHEYRHLAQLGRYHQLTVDAYGAQHAGEPTPAISTAFSLIGLHLALDEGWSGTAVRAAHQWIAERRPGWPAFTPPTAGEWMTVANVAASTTPSEHAERVEAWAASAWEAWQLENDHVRTWTDTVLPADVRDRLRTA